MINTLPKCIIIKISSYLYEDKYLINFGLTCKRVHSALEKYIKYINFKTISSEEAYIQLKLFGFNKKQLAMNAIANGIVPNLDDLKLISFVEIRHFLVQASRRGHYIESLSNYYYGIYICYIYTEVVNKNYYLIEILADLEVKYYDNIDTLLLLCHTIIPYEKVDIFRKVFPKIDKIEYHRLMSTNNEHVLRKRFERNPECINSGLILKCLSTYPKYFELLNEFKYSYSADELHLICIMGKQEHIKKAIMHKHEIIKNPNEFAKKFPLHTRFIKKIMRKIGYTNL